MRKTVGLVALLIASAAAMVQPALARDRDDYARNDYARETPVYQPVRREIRPDYNNDNRQVRHDYRPADNHYRNDYRR